MKKLFKPQVTEHQTAGKIKIHTRLAGTAGVPELKYIRLVYCPVSKIVHTQTLFTRTTEVHEFWVMLCYACLRDGRQLKAVVRKEGVTEDELLEIGYNAAVYGASQALKSRA